MTPVASGFLSPALLAAISQQQPQPVQQGLLSPGFFSRMGDSLAGAENTGADRRGLLGQALLGMAAGMAQTGGQGFMGALGNGIQSGLLALNQGRQHLSDERYKAQLARDQYQQQFAPRVVGNALVDAQGNVLYEAPEQQDYQWSDRAGAWIPKPTSAPSAASAPIQTAANTYMGPNGPFFIDPNLPPEAQQAAMMDGMGGGLQDSYAVQKGGGLAAIPVAGIGPRPEISDAERLRLQLALEANRRAQEAADRAARGTPPAGYRWNAEGTAVEPIPGSPAPAAAAASEDERKAAGWYGQATRAIANMEAALSEDQEADIPGLIESYSPVDEVANRSRSPSRQKYYNAASSLSEAILRAATGAGVNADEARQKIAELTPQRGDSEAVRKQKRAAAAGYIQDLKARAGRALGPVDPRVSAPGATPQQSGVLRYNPDTGDFE